MKPTTLVSVSKDYNRML